MTLAFLVTSIAERIFSKEPAAIPLEVVALRALLAPFVIVGLELAAILWPLHASRWQKALRYA